MEQQLREILETFIEKAHKLKSFNFEEHIKSVGLGFHFYRTDKDGGWITEFGQADEKERDAFLLTFRLFIQQNEPISFHGLKKLLNSSELSDDWKKKVGSAVEAYFEYYYKYPGDIQDLWGARPTHGEILDTVLNGGISHTGLNERYKHKRERFREWTRDDIRENVLLQVFTRIVVNVSQLIYCITDLTVAEVGNVQSVGIRE